MNMTDEDALALAAEIDLHMRALLRADSQKKTAIEWMKQAYNLLEKASSALRAPKIYSVPGTFGVRTYMLTPPKQLVLPPAGFTSAQPVWIGGKTIEYGDKYQNKYRPWTPKDTRNLIREREAAQNKSRMKISRKGK